MPCRHKFYNDLLLQRLDYFPTTLMVGTFNPQWPEENTADWFYGRVPRNAADLDTGNHYWGVLPRIYGQTSLKYAGAAPAWKDFCQQHGIAITDLIAGITDASLHNPQHVQQLRTYSDRAIATEFQTFELIPVVQLLKDHPTIRNVYLTRGTGETFWRRLWHPVQEYCNRQGIHHQTLLTPSDYCYYQQGRYNRLHPAARLSREDFVLMRWRQQWHSLQPKS